MEDWPKMKEALINKNLNKEMAAIRKIVSLGLAVRGKAKIKVRQPLALLQVALPRGIQKKWITAQKSVILEELNVKGLEILDEAGNVIQKHVSPNARVLGPKYGKDVQQIINEAKAGKFEILDDGRVKVGKFILDASEVEVGYKGQEGYDVESQDGVVVILDTKVTEDLVLEGYAREIVRSIQDLRKEADYNVSDRIDTTVIVQDGGADSDSDEGGVARALLRFTDYIKKETLSIDLSQEGDFKADVSKEVDVAGTTVRIELKKAS